MTQLFIFCPHSTSSNDEPPNPNEAPFKRPYTLFSPLHDSRFGSETFAAGELVNSVCVEQTNQSIVSLHRAFHVDNRVHRGGVQLVLHLGGFALFLGAFLLFGT